MTSHRADMPRTVYEQGQSVPQDYALAALWYCRAADQDSGFPDDVPDGYGVQQDYVQAHNVVQSISSAGVGSSGDPRRH